MAARRQPAKAKETAKPVRPKRQIRRSGLAARVSSIRASLAAALGSQLKPEDAAALELLCRAIAELEDSQREIEKEPIVTLPNGVKTVNPHAKLVDINRKIVADGFRRFGLSPLDRARLEESAPPPAPATAAARPEGEEADFEKHLQTRPATIPINGRREAG